MKPSQQKYVVKRVEAITARKREIIKKEERIKYKEYTLQEIQDNILNEVFAPIDCSMETHTYQNTDGVHLSRLFYLPDFTYSTTYSPKLEEREDALTKETNKLIDQIMLGDSDEALKLIQVFEEQQF